YGILIAPGQGLGLKAPAHTPGVVRPGALAVGREHLDEPAAHGRAPQKLREVAPKAGLPGLRGTRQKEGDGHRHHPPNSTVTAASGSGTTRPTCTSGTWDSATTPPPSRGSNVATHGRGWKWCARAAKAHTGKRPERMTPS